MKTKKTRLLEILGDTKFYDKGELCTILTYEGYGYADSTARTLRKMTEDNVLTKKSKTKGTAYCLNPVKPSKHITGNNIYEVAKSIS